MNQNVVYFSDLTTLSVRAAAAGVPSYTLQFS